MWKKMMQFMFKAFEGLQEWIIEQAVEFYKEQIKALGVSLEKFLEEADKYYDQLGGSDAIIAYLKTIDKNPDDDRLDLLPLLWPGAEEKLVKLVAPRAFRAFVKYAKKAVSGLGQDQEQDQVQE